MKMIGFNKLHDKNLAISKYNHQLDEQNSLYLNESEIKIVSNYLEGSEMIFSKTLALFDKDKYIGVYMIFTDGEWIWPSYYSYYLAKEKRIAQDFFFQAKEKNFRISKLDSKQKRESILFLEKAILNM